MGDPTTTWGAGDYPLMAVRLEPAARAAVAAAAVGPGDRVLDVATGTGNAALFAAALGAQATGVDFEPSLLEMAGRRGTLRHQASQRRASQLGAGHSGARHQVRWLHGELGALPVPDEAFDVVLSVFGVMYAADHAAAAAELARVGAPGARIVLASWVPGGAMPAMGAVLGGYLPPPPPASGPPSRWGDPEALAALLEPCGLRLTGSERHAIVLWFPDADAGAEFLIDTAGHVVTERARLVREGRWGALAEDVRAFVAERSERVDGTVELTLDYLLTSATKDHLGGDPA
ncbi:methyltransferase domain-containing protein [Longispora urticae]